MEKPIEVAHMMTPEERHAWEQSIIAPERARLEAEFAETRGRPEEVVTAPKDNIKDRDSRVKWAAGCVEARGTLVNQNDHIRFQLRSKNVPMLKNLRTLFGGNVLPHNGGMLWLLAGRRKVEAFLRDVTPNLTRNRRREFRIILNPALERDDIE